MSVKEMALGAIGKMPEEITWDDLLEELQILSSLRRADAEVDAGDFSTHEEVKQEIASWFSK